MRFSIEHATRYLFSGPVFLEPHCIRLTPRQDPTQQLTSFSMTLDPAPAGRWDGLDQEGNPFVQAWFDGLNAELRIETRIEAVCLRSNPFGFLIGKAAQRIPPVLEPAEAAVLAPCLRRAWPSEQNDPVAAMARELAGNSVNGGLDFLLALNTRLFRSLEKVVRLEPGIVSPAETLAEGRGACRDLTALFMDCCRAAGIPARFVSGYQAGDEEAPGRGRDLHAWAEAWLPEAGWLGFDPTHGLMVADRHLALAASHDPDLAAPVRGSFRGTGVTARLEHEVRLRAED